MYRCHFTQNGHIVAGENLNAVSLDEAISMGEQLLMERAPTDKFDGIEIWDRAIFLYASCGWKPLEAAA